MWVPFIVIVIIIIIIIISSSISISISIIILKHISFIKIGTQAKGIWKQDPEENIWN